MKSMLQQAYFSNNLLKKEAHYHDCHQIILITKGTVEFYVNHAKHTAQAGHILLFSRYESHSLHVTSSEYERYILHIDPKAGGIGSRVYALLANRPAGFCNAVDVSEQIASFESLFCRIAKEHQTRAKLSGDMLQLLVNELLILVYRALPDTLSFDEIVYTVQRQLENHCHEPYSLEALARQHAISPSSLSHRFKQHTGSSVMEYLLSCRMALAKRYLTQTTRSIGEIVEICGFSDNSNFSRTFKRMHGISPSDFREQYRCD